MPTSKIKITIISLLFILIISCLYWICFYYTQEDASSIATSASPIVLVKPVLQPHQVESPIQTSTKNLVPETPALDPKALQLIEALSTAPQGITKYIDNEMIEPKEFPALVKMGSQAIPTLISMMQKTEDSWTRGLLIDIIGKIKDPMARLALEKLLDAEPPISQDNALEALSQIGSKESIPFLKKALLKKSTTPDVAINIYEVLLNLGDDTVISEVLKIGSQSDDLKDKATEVLRQHKPIRDALGLKNEYNKYSDEIDNKNLAFNAADEWYHEVILKKESPYRTPKDLKFPEPFAAEKVSAWNLLKKECVENRDKFSEFRPSPADQINEDIDPKRALVFITGYGHGHNLNLYTLIPNLDNATFHHYNYRRGEKRTTFSEDHWRTSYRSGNFELQKYKRLIAGLKTINDAKLTPWWSGPGRGSSWSSGNFVITIIGLGQKETDASSYCGYPRGNSRVEYLKLMAAQKLFMEFLTSENLDKLPNSEPGDKIVFSKIFKLIHLQEPEKWWVHERFLSLTRDFGDHTLIEHLKQYLEKEFILNKINSRIAYIAINALVVITEKDFRFDKDGTPKDLQIVAQEYLDWIENK